MKKQIMNKIEKYLKDLKVALKVCSEPNIARCHKVYELSLKIETLLSTLEKETKGAMCGGSHLGGKCTFNNRLEWLRKRSKDL